MMKARDESRANRRIDYHWRADHTAGFETTSMIYDKEGRLVAIDYVVTPAARTEKNPLDDSSVAGPCQTS
jgi:hypothetical protein